MDEFVQALKEALQSEFGFLMGMGITAPEESWDKAARGITEKMGVATTRIDADPRIPIYWLKGTT